MLLCVYLKKKHKYVIIIIIIVLFCIYAVNRDLTAGRLRTAEWQKKMSHKTRNAQSCVTLFSSFCDPEATSCCCCVRSPMILLRETLLLNQFSCDITCSLFSPMFSFNCYKRGLISAAATSALRLHQRLPVSSFEN